MSEQFLKRKALKLDPAVMAKRNAEALLYKDLRRNKWHRTARALFNSSFNARFS